MTAKKPESVWDYPRPPVVEPANARVRVMVAGTTIAESMQAFRVLETSHPPVYYIPPNDVELALLVAAPNRTFCEWKGVATYYDVDAAGEQVRQAAWCYANPSKRFATIQDYLAFYPSKMEACYVDNERVEAQAGDFYGGWITSNIVGPFKGGPGTRGW